MKKKKRKRKCRYACAMLEALQEKEQEHVLHLQGIKIHCATNGKMSNIDHKMLGKANKMQEKTKE